MMVSAKGFADMTARVMALADEVCGGKLVLVHEGGYAEAYVPFCGHAVMAQLAGSAISAGDPLGEMIAARQPNARVQAFHRGYVDDYAAYFGLA